jgi:hypothetical protein
MRSVLAVFGGFVIFYVLYGMLETTTVRALAGAPITDVAGYLAVRNRPGVAAAQFALVPLAGLLAGYMTGRIAGIREVFHGAAAAMFAGGLIIQGFMTSDVAPHALALRALLVVVAAAALIIGAYVRGQARILGSQT